MPRIDPSQLLKCLSVLLSSSGGIKSKDEVNRVANLMTKFSKKLVSKCIYILILKSTEIDILDMFMSADGWDLVFNWLSDGIAMQNWSLVEEIVELLLVCPVSIQRLKGNNCPKIIKSLSKDVSATEKVRELACEVVEQWLAIVKGACEATSSYQQPSVTTPTEVTTNAEPTTESESNKEVYKITIRDGKQILAEVVSDKTGSRVDEVKEDDSHSDVEEPTKPSVTASGRPARKGKAKILEDLSESETDTSDEDFKVTKSRKRIKPLKSPKPTSARKTKLVEVKKQGSKEKEPKEEKKKTPTIVRSRLPEPASKPESKKSESSKVTKHDAKTSKVEKEMLDKDRATLAKLVTPSISSMGRIPKKSKDSSGKEKETKKEEKKEVKREEKKPDKKPVEPPKPVPKDPKKYNYSTEIRKHDNERPKTVVKTFNSKFRSTGLEETPPPPKGSKSEKSSKSESEGKKSPKRISPLKDVVPEKKAKLSHDDHKSKHKEDKITSPKPKSLQECDLFGDALTAANDFKDQKKRKRRPSNSGGTPSGKESPPKKLHSIKEEPSDDEEYHPPSHNKKSDTKPNLRFYQDTMETDVKSEFDKKPTDIKKEIKLEDQDTTGGQVDDQEIADEIVKTEEAINKQLKMEDIKNQEREKNRVVSGILVYVKKNKSVSKSVQWRPQHTLIQTKYFELDETERVNVTKTFMDMKQMERTNEREQLMLSRKLALNDIMEERIMWRPLIPIDLQPDIAERGKNSLEKDIQMQRERTVVPAIYFNKKLIPDSPAEPDLEIHAQTEPIIIPLVDQTGNTESVISYKSTGWPEPVETPPVEPILPPTIPIHTELPSMQTMPPGPIAPLMEYGPPPAGFFPGQMGGIGQTGPPPAAMLPPGGIPPMWMNGDGTPMMGPPPDMLLGPPQPGVPPGVPPGVMPPPEIAAQFGMGPPMGPPFMGPPPGGFNQGPPPPMFQDGPPPRNNRPWNNFQGGGGGGQWRKGRGGNDGGNWGRDDSGRHGGRDRDGNKKSSRTCLNIIKRGYCKTPHCQFKHPPPR